MAATTILESQLAGRHETDNSPHKTRSATTNYSSCHLYSKCEDLPQSTVLSHKSISAQVSERYLRSTTTTNLHRISVLQSVRLMLSVSFARLTNRPALPSTTRWPHSSVSLPAGLGPITKTHYLDLGKTERNLSHERSNTLFGKKPSPSSRDFNVPSFTKKTRDCGSDVTTVEELTTSLESACFRHLNTNNPASKSCLCMHSQDKHEQKDDVQNKHVRDKLTVDEISSSIKENCSKKYENLQTKSDSGDSDRDVHTKSSDVHTKSSDVHTKSSDLVHFTKMLNKYEKQQTWKDNVSFLGSLSHHRNEDEGFNVLPMSSEASYGSTHKEIVSDDGTQWPGPASRQRPLLSEKRHINKSIIPSYLFSSNSRHLQEPTFPDNKGETDEHCNPFGGFADRNRGVKQLRSSLDLIQNSYCRDSDVKREATKYEARLIVKEPNKRDMNEPKDINGNTEDSKLCLGVSSSLYTGRQTSVDQAPTLACSGKGHRVVPTALLGLNKSTALSPIRRSQEWVIHRDYSSTNMQGSRYGGQLNVWTQRNIENICAKDLQLSGENLSERTNDNVILENITGHNNFDAMFEATKQLKKVVSLPNVGQGQAYKKAVIDKVLVPIPKKAVMAICRSHQNSGASDSHFLDNDDTSFHDSQISGTEDIIFQDSSTESNEDTRFDDSSTRFTEDTRFEDSVTRCTEDKRFEDSATRFINDRVLLDKAFPHTSTAYNRFRSKAAIRDKDICKASSDILRNHTIQLPAIDYRPRQNGYKTFHEREVERLFSRNRSQCLPSLNSSDLVGSNKTPLTKHTSDLPRLKSLDLTRTKTIDKKPQKLLRNTNDTRVTQGRNDSGCEEVEILESRRSHPMPDLVDYLWSYQGMGRLLRSTGRLPGRVPQLQKCFPSKIFNSLSPVDHADSDARSLDTSTCQSGDNLEKSRFHLDVWLPRLEVEYDEE